jgi:hypothetical protein
MLHDSAPWLHKHLDVHADCARVLADCARWSKAIVKINELLAQNKGLHPLSTSTRGRMCLVGCSPRKLTACQHGCRCGDRRQPWNGRAAGGGPEPHPTSWRRQYDGSNRPRSHIPHVQCPSERTNANGWCRTVARAATSSNGGTHPAGSMPKDAGRSWSGARSRFGIWM